jgi:GntR family transcriptional regulator
MVYCTIGTDNTYTLEVGAITDQPLWEDVADGLRASLASGKYGPDDTLPSEALLAKQYDVSRDTVRRALNRLTQQGLLLPGRGRLGRKVRVSRKLTYYAVLSESQARIEARRPAGVDAWVADVHEQGRKAGQSISVGVEGASPEVADRLKIPAGELVVVRRRLRTIDGEPHNLNDTHYLRSVAEGTPIMDPADVTQGTIALMRDMGYLQVRNRDDLETRMPTPAEAERLQIPPGVPVFVQYRTGYTSDGPVKVTVTVWPGDRATLVYEFQA